ncbi:FecR family protein [Wenyingzhuangia marina]|uniref:FecR family protein n=1 Tax=Wenyingzhuangia marina TaxID=1195760 RepID=A0A1M5UJ19_9FLAO|nr:FecR family protein [Wenyingzhuangia marina]GGF67393.1 iron dicitrate transporter FecR [Wenyingzhuangia marina]SHH62898.1 FecR family protein [Wenyingzhuangia marina]
MEFKLIIKKINNTLTKEEEITFSEWYKESKSHRDYFLYVKNHIHVDLDIIDIEKGWLRLDGDLKKRRQEKNIYKYGIAASIAVLFSIGYIFIQKDSKNIKNHTVIAVNEIKAGTDKAILTLANGVDVSLEKGKLYNSQNVSSNGEEIIYKNKEEKDDELVYNYLTVPRGGQFSVKLSDGTQVFLNSESKLKFPVKFIEGLSREVELVYGEAYFDVSPSEDHKGSKFKVLNHSQEVEVIGTEFNIKAYKNEDNVYTTLVEGKVFVTNGVLKRNIEPGQQSIISLNNNYISVHEADIKSEISWKKGVFSFKQKSLREIMKVISRWYNVEVVFVNKNLETVKFNGVFNKSQNIEQILSIMKSTTINGYRIKDKTLIIE